jgi:hypothetical protein
MAKSTVASRLSAKNRYMPVISIGPAVTLDHRDRSSTIATQEDSHRCHEKHNLQKRSRQLDRALAVPKS